MPERSSQCPLFTELYYNRTLESGQTAHYNREENMGGKFMRAIVLAGGGARGAYEIGA